MQGRKRQKKKQKQKNKTKQRRRRRRRRRKQRAREKEGKKKKEDERAKGGRECGSVIKYYFFALSFFFTVHSYRWLYTVARS